MHIKSKQCSKQDVSAVHSCSSIFYGYKMKKMRRSRGKVNSKVREGAEEVKTGGITREQRAETETNSVPSCLPVPPQQC